MIPAHQTARALSYKSRNTLISKCESMLIKLSPISVDDPELDKFIFDVEYTLENLKHLGWKIGYPHRLQYLNKEYEKLKEKYEF